MWTQVKKRSLKRAIKWEKSHQFTYFSTQLLLCTFYVYKSIIFVKLILQGYQICKHYWQGDRKIYRVQKSFFTLWYTLALLSSHIRGSKQIWIQYAKTYDFQIKYNCSLNVHMVKYTKWSKLCIFQQKRSLIWLLTNTAYIIGARKYTFLISL